MRLFTIAVLGFALASGSSMAAQNTPATPPSPSSGHNYGSANCSQKVPCAGGVPSLSSSDLIEMTSSCLQQRFGFDATSALSGADFDSNNCISGSAQFSGPGSGKSLIPTCCVVKITDDMCMLHCDLNSN